MLGYRRKPVREAVSALGWIYGSYALLVQGIDLVRVLPVYE